MLQGGKSFEVVDLLLRLTCTSRDVTDHLQLLLRKSGHHLHTSAEKEVVRTIKEKCCYVALNPSKEDKDTLGRTEEFRLPDGNVVQVRISEK
jgi:centractin